MNEEIKFKRQELQFSKKKTAKYKRNWLMFTSLEKKLSEAYAIFARNVLEFKLKLNLLNVVLGEVDKEVFEENQYSTQKCETTPSEVSKESKVSVVSEILETTPSKNCNEKEKDSSNDEEKLLIDDKLHDDLDEGATSVEESTENATATVEGI